MPNRTQVGLVHHPRLPEAERLVRSLAADLALQDRCWVSSSADIDAGAETLDDTSVIITAGGDGTILQTVRAAAPHQVPILGINMGRVGFMTELTVEDAVDKVPSYLAGDARVEERMMLQASVASAQGAGPRLTVHALNDIVVSSGQIGLLDVEVGVDRANLYTYRADGLIIATPTGSTGYALSAGGPIVYPEATSIQIQPVAAHLSFQSGIIVSGDSTVELRLAPQYEAVLTVDGFADTTLGPDDTVTVQRSPHVASFLRGTPPAEFYARLTARLSVGRGPAVS